MTERDGYALDLLSPVRHVATEMERAGLDGPAPTVEAMAATYEHTIRGDLARIREHEGATTDYEARLWLVRRAVQELGKQVASDGNSGFRLAKPFDELRYRRRKVRRTVSEDDEDEKRALRAVYNDLEHERSFYVTVTGARGGTRNAQFTLHPLARAIPQMSEKEFADLAKDVKANGVKLPITVMGGKVIDGRHRLAVAAALKIPVRIEEFGGSEDDARHHIVSLNLVRRHLTMAQRGLIVQQIFLPEAERRAKERLRAAGQEHGRGMNSLGPVDPRLNGAGKAIEEAAHMSMGLASAKTLQRMEPVRHAPKTQDRIRKGEIKSAQEARREALREVGSDEPADAPVLQPRSAYDRLGCALGDVRSAIASVETTGRYGDVPSDKLLERIAEVKAKLDRLGDLVRQ